MSRPFKFFICLTALLFPAQFARAGNACVFSDISKAHSVAEANSDERFSLTDKIHFAIDQLITQSEIRRLYECVLSISFAKEELENFAGVLKFVPFLSQMYANNYSFGTVGKSKNSVGKITIKINPDGAVVLDDIFVLKKNGTSVSWWRYKNHTFQRDDVYCLSCHQRQRKNAYLFGQSFYRRVKD